ncbi:uncharacterized protein MELLADRAFT_94161 [Melampsora larici-populina 98AG31]|uniref:Uncharacterized protein n=1 Tax=Melampsora larici-populina (strain 98AG31 / pathotype 3-4-7) TaxID=747676 RepID=F4S6P6_MELLP|nr:uncharacterized protein MELLADRAFT_94161 [Melampsora larici-populina 98AG31]EGF99606.1 hypothetical protein MELLADRAFT_94161 [Melampsora larici-populina 98AG31]
MTQRSSSPSLVISQSLYHAAVIHVVPQRYSLLQHLTTRHQLSNLIIIIVDLNPATYCGIYLSGNFEVEGKVCLLIKFGQHHANNLRSYMQTLPDNGWRSEYKTYTISIGCGGVDRQEPLLYEIAAKGFSGAKFKLHQDHVYFLRGALFPSNSPDTRANQFIFEGSDVVMLGPRDNYGGKLVDSVGVTCLGIVIGISSIVKDCCQYMKKTPDQESVLTTVFTVQHSDYHPIMKTARTSTVEYCIRPTPNLAKIASIVRVGQECQFHGFIKDFNEETPCYIVIANKVHMTTGFQDIPSQSNTQNEDNLNTLKKPKKFIPRTLSNQNQAPITVHEGISSVTFGSADEASLFRSSSSGQSLERRLVENVGRGMKDDVLVHVFNAYGIKCLFRPELSPKDMLESLD